MYLFSTTYGINQHVPKLFQFETKGEQNAPKPIFLKHLRAVGAFRRDPRAGRGPFRDRLGQVKRNELGLVGAAKTRTGEKPPQQNASAAEGDSRRQKYRTHDDAQKNDVDQKVSNVVLLVEIRVLVAGDPAPPR